METPLSTVQSSPSSQASITKYFKTDQESTKKGECNRKCTLEKHNQNRSKKRWQEVRRDVFGFWPKDFGYLTFPTCGMVYTKGQPEDKGHHVKFHATRDLLVDSDSLVGRMKEYFMNLWMVALSWSVQKTIIYM